MDFLSLPLSVAIVAYALNRVSDRALSVLERRVALEEREIERKSKPLEIMEPVPQDIQEYINMQSEKWAREDLSKLASELYTEERSWDKVRSRLVEV